jgi:hypothetical protein
METRVFLMHCGEQATILYIKLFGFAEKVRDKNDT